MSEYNFHGVTLRIPRYWDGNPRMSDEDAASLPAWLEEFRKEALEANKEEPLPEDFMDYCKGRKAGALFHLDDLERDEGIHERACVAE